jgi:hypothetical protein
MSINRLMLLQQASPSANEPAAPDWLLHMLRELMTAVAQEDGDILKKAGMIARLGALYLRASGAAELKRSHRELARRCAQLEEQLAALQARAEAVPPPAAEPNESVRPARAPAIPPASTTVRRGTPTAPLGLEPEAPPILVVGPPDGRSRASPTP